MQHNAPHTTELLDELMTHVLLSTPASSHQASAPPALGSCIAIAQPTAPPAALAEASLPLTWQASTTMALDQSDLGNACASALEHLDSEMLLDATAAAHHHQPSLDHPPRDNELESLLRAFIHAEKDLGEWSSILEESTNLIGPAGMASVLLTYNFILSFYVFILF
jgi:hypothetical protein